MPNLPKSVGPGSKDITSRSVLLVEGNDEEGFLGALVEDMGLQIGRDIEFWLTYGTGFEKKLTAILNNSGFYNVRSYAIVRDADGSAEDKFKSIQHILEDADQPYPAKNGEFSDNTDKRPKVGIFIMPGNHVEGRMLEDLCLESVRDHAIMPFVEEYITNVKNTVPEGQAPTNEPKAKVQTFMAGMKDIVPHLGVAAKRGYWNFRSTAINEIRAFIHELTTI